MHTGVGLPENDVFPTVSYSDFNVLSSNRNVNWHSLCTYVHEKYEKRSKAGDAVAASFVTSLGKHRANLGGQKSILIVPGFWEGLGRVSDGMNLAQNILRSSNFKVFVVVDGNRSSTTANARELNPHIMGHGLSREVVSRHFCTVPVCLGEKVFGGGPNFNLEHNVHNLFLLGVKRCGPPPAEVYGSDMLFPLSFFTPSTYVPAPIDLTGSEVNGEYFLAACAQADKKVFEFVPFGDAGYHKRLVPDPGRVWPSYATWELFTEDVSSLSDVKALFVPPTDEKGPSPPDVCSHMGFGTSTFFGAPCSPSGRSRVLRLGSLSPFQKVGQRAGPLSVLQHLHLTEQALPLTDFYLKVQLIEGLTDECFTEQLRKFNDQQGANVFHSLYNGDRTIVVAPPPAPGPGRVFPLEGKAWDGFKVSPPSVLVIENPPLRLSLPLVTAWATAQGLAHSSVSWFSGPSGSSCVALTFQAQAGFAPPSTVEFPNGRAYRLRFSESEEVFRKDHRALGEVQDLPARFYGQLP